MGNTLDITGRVDTTDCISVCAEVVRIYRALYVREPAAALARAFEDAARLFRGDFPGCTGSDARHQDLRHALEVALAMARLLDGYERWRGGEPAIGARLFRFGVLCALFHDAGYACRGRGRGRGEARDAARHVARSARFLRAYLPTARMPDLAAAGARLLAYTDHRRSAASIRSGSPTLARLGRFLGSADLIAQMADPDWIDRWQERLGSEPGLGGDGSHAPSREERLRRAARAFRSAQHRLEFDFGGEYEFGRAHFAGDDRYGEAIRRNARVAERIAAAESFESAPAAVDRRQSHPRQQA